MLSLYLRSVDAVKAKKGAELLQDISGIWSTYCQRLRMAENILMFLDRCHVLQRPELKSIQYERRPLFIYLLNFSELGVSMFRHHFLQHSGLFDSIRSALLDSILALRLSKALGEVTLQKNLIFLLVDTGLFGEFEPALLRETSQQYQRSIVSDDLKGFDQLEIVAFWLLFEERLAEGLAYPQETRSRLVKIAEEMVLLNGLGTLVSSGLPVLVEATWKDSTEQPELAEPPMNDFSELQKGPDDRLFDLRLLVKLAMRANGSEVLKSNWIKFIKAYGASILSSSRSGEMVEELLEFKARLETVLSSVFNREPAMENATKEAFESFVNARSTKLAELIARYLDGLLREGKPGSATERQSDAQLLPVIDGVIVLFRFLQSKEAVETFYKQLLAKRLLQGRSLSMELEREVVRRFKTECGAAFTSRLEGMFKDIDAAPELNRLFRESYSEGPAMDIGLTVISSGIWPHPEDTGMRLPKAVEDFQAAFEAYYAGKHNGRRLEWNQSMASCIIKAPFAQGAKELLVSVPQAVVLDCFNVAERLTFGDLLKATRMEAGALQETLLSLSGRHPVLLREAGAGGDKANKTDVYAYNGAFTSRLVRIRLNTSAAREVVEELAAAVAPLQLEDMQYRIDAAIVRTAKAGKRLPRLELVQQAMAALGIHSLTKADYEKRIDVLISRDFLTKDAEDPSALSYVP